MGKNWLIVVMLLTLIVLLVRFYDYHNQKTDILDGNEVSLETRLMEDPDVRDGRQQFRIKTNNNQRIYITTGLDPKLKYGDKIEISGIIREKVYDDYSLFTIDFPDIQIVNNDHNFIAGAAAKIRQKSDKIYQSVLPPVSAGLLSGIVFGGDRNLPEEFSDDLRVSGVTHVIAASGMNVTFVASFLMGAFALLLRRQIAITITIFGIFFYAFIAGFESSIVRAAIMGSIVFSARLIGRQSLALVSLVLTTFAMLLYNPGFVMDVGFQLSVAATAGIVLIKPIIDGGFVRLGVLGKLGKEDIGTTIAAQIGTLPILLGVFGTFSLLSVFVNAIVLWTIPILMVIGGIGLMAGFVFEPLGQLIVLLAAPLLFYFESVVTFFAQFDWSMSIDNLSASISLGYYLVLAGWIVFMHKRKGKIEAKNKNAP